MEGDLRTQIREREKSLPLSAQQADLLEKAYLEIGQSGIAARVPKAGEEAPDFTLPNAVARPISLSGALAAGPAVVTFYRGIW